MHRRLGSPSPESLSIEVEWDGTETPQGCKCHVQHDGLDKPALFHPGGDELTEAVAPEILIYSNGHED